jgi:hypothetical protein
VRNWPVPKNKKDLRGFLGLANYYAAYIYNGTGGLLQQTGVMPLQQTICLLQTISNFNPLCHFFRGKITVDSFGYGTGFQVLAVGKLSVDYSQRIHRPRPTCTSPTPPRDRSRSCSSPLPLSSLLIPSCITQSDSVGSMGDRWHTRTDCRVR